jgi:hypothetical protein
MMPEPELPPYHSTPVGLPSYLWFRPDLPDPPIHRIQPEDIPVPGFLLVHLAERGEGLAGGWDEFAGILSWSEERLE